MRVIVGRHRGRRLVAPPGRATRPILDRVKQALFDRLGVHFGTPSEIPPIAVLDLFAGAGNLGIEALSRGAASCTFVESEPAALKCLGENLASLELGAVARVVRGAAEQVVLAAPPSGGFGLVFLDPPYPLSDALIDYSPIGRVLRRLGEEWPVAPDALIVWRFDRDLAPPPTLPGGWRRAARHDYGSMSLVFLERGSG